MAKFENNDVWSRPRTTIGPKPKSSSPFAIFKNPYALVGMGVLGYVLFRGGYNTALAAMPPPPSSFPASSDYAKFAQDKRMLVARGQPEQNANLDDFYVKTTLATRPGEFGVHSINAKNSGSPYPVQWFSLVDGHSTGSTTAGS